MRTQMKVKLNKLKVDPYQPRRTIDQEELKELAQSIYSNHGKLLYPVIVDRNFVIIDGERRLRAYQKLNHMYPGQYDEIEITVLEELDVKKKKDRLTLQIMADIQHKKLPILERDEAWFKLWKELGKPNVAIFAKLIGVSETAIKESLERTEFLSHPDAPKIQEVTTGMSISRTKSINDPKVRARVIEKLNKENVRVKEQIDSFVGQIKAAPDTATVEAILKEPVNPDTKVAGRMVTDMQNIRQNLTKEFVARLPAQAQYNLLGEVKMLIGHLRTWQAEEGELA